MASASTIECPVIPREQLIKVKEFPAAVGSYGQVFQCIMQQPGAPEALVAVKVLIHASKKRARREMKLWMAARHDNIVPLLGIAEGFTEEGFAMVSPWKGGGTLALYLRDHEGNIPCRKKLTLIKDVTIGLAYLHSRKIVHGDLTTTNVVLDESGKALLIDFGLSNVLGGMAGSCLSLSVARPGAVRFAAPELLVAEEATSQPTGMDSAVDNESPVLIPNVPSDIYSLGCVMLNVFTEKLPWHTYVYSNLAIVGAHHAKESMPFPSHDHLSKERKQFICECTSVEVGSRPSSQDAVVFIEEELRIEDIQAPTQQSITKASNRDIPTIVLHKLDTEIPSHIQEPIANVVGRLHPKVNPIRASFVRILAITTARDACIDGDLYSAEDLLTQDINTNPNNHTSYAHRSLVMARKHDWDHALQDAIKSISIQPSLIGYISKGIAFCGTGRIRNARAAFDVASMYTDQDSQTIHFLLLIKVIALFNADQHDEANLLLKELVTGYPNANTRACHIVEAYLRVQLGLKALDGAHHNEAADHFTAALNSSNLSSKLDIHEIYEDLVVLFGWNLKSLWLTAHQKRCHALLQAGKLQDAVKSYQYMMVWSDENTKVDCLDWSHAFIEECSALCLNNGDAALAASKYDEAIDLYSAVINMNSASDVVFANRSKAKLGKMLWEDALLDAQKVTELNPSSHIGYELTHTALRGAQRYDEAIVAFKIMLSKLKDSPDPQIRDLRQQYVCPSEAEDAIQQTVCTELEYAPLRLLNTSMGLLYDRAAQINAFKSSAKYKELLSFTTKHSDLQIDRIKEVVAMYFRCVLLSHRWEEKEALLHDIQDKVVYELNTNGGIVKLQSFCKIARDAGYYWAWMDTCCIDRKSSTELQESVNSMFAWYRNSALTIVYLCDVLPSSQPGALARSVWNQRGWTFQEFVAPKVVIFYQKDWSLYLDDRSPNHKESPAIMKELEDAMGIDAQALISFRPGMSGARERLQWASKRVTTVQEDIAYSLFGIFGITLPVIYGEKKQNALGRLLQEIVARSGDITVLDWIGQPSEFNSCLPAHITSYTAPPRTLASLSEDHIHTQISSLRQTVPTDLALKIYDQLEQLRVPRFANCRLQLPCISFRVTEVRRRRILAQKTPITYRIKADGLHDLLITTEETLVQFSRERPIQQTFLLVRPWDRYLLGVPDFTAQPDFIDDMESIGDWTEPGSTMDDSQMDDSDKLPGGLPVEEEPRSRALRLLVRLGQPFDAFLLAQQHVGEYKRIASDRNIIARVKDIASVDSMYVGTVEIL